MELIDRRRRQARIYDRTHLNNSGRAEGRIVRKQISDQAHWLRVMENIEEIVPTSRVDELIEIALEEMKRFDGMQTAFGWSGGKDSLALEVVMKEADVTECVFVMTDLEYPEFLAWATDRMPDGCEVSYQAGINLSWLGERPEMLFPPDAVASAKWFSAVQHKGQAEYIRRRGIEVMYLGRRSLDGNMTGKNGYTKSSRGTFFNPIRTWTHEEVLACITYAGIEMPPTYSWPRGFQVGSGPWPARQFCRDVQMGWSEVFTIDETIVRQAARVIPSAEQFLRSVS